MLIKSFFYYNYLLLNLYLHGYEHWSQKNTEGDRKANVDVLEANKAANKEEIKRLRDENKELRQKLALLQRTSAKDEVTINT